MRPTTFSDRSLLAISLALFAFAMACSVLGTPSWLENLLRAAVLGFSVGIVAITLAIVRVYWRNFKIAPQHARLLPRHVIQLGILVMLLLFVTSVITIDKIGLTLVWYGIPFLLPAGFIGFVGTLDMIRWLPDRRRNIHPTGERSG